MRFVTVVGASCLAASVAFLPASVPAAAGPERITGKLSKPGYTVIGLAANGKAKTVRATRGRFRLRPPAGRLTLHLRAPNGKYAGPIVVGRKKGGRRAILGVRAGARLGRVKVRRGYATLSKRPRKKWVDATRWARARRGVPIGVGVFGRVRSRPPGSFEEPLRPEDRDVDGVPNVLDIDDDGDLVLDNFDRRPLFYGGSRRAGSTSARAAQESDEPDADEFGVRSDLELELHQTTNANHPALAAQIDAKLSSFGNLRFGLKGGPLPAGAELDCAQPQHRFNPSVGGLVYCSSDGTGRVFSGCLPPAFECPFPGPRGSEPFDTDGDGFGTLTPSDAGGGAFLRHGATTDEIGTGDLLILRASDRDRPATVQSLIATVPALISYDDDGPAGRDPTPVAYPVAGPTLNPMGPIPGGPGTQGNGFPVAPRPAGDPNAGEVVLTLKFWRPQRKPIAQDACLPACEWIDLGGLSYGVTVGGGLQGGPPNGCPQHTLSEEDKDLGPPAGERTDQFTDTARDRAARPRNTFSYTLNLTRCLESIGLGQSFDEPGEQQGLQFRGNAPTRIDNATQGVTFKRQ